MILSEIMRNPIDKRLSLGVAYKPNCHVCAISLSKQYAANDNTVGSTKEYDTGCVRVDTHGASLLG